MGEKIAFSSGIFKIYFTGGICNPCRIYALGALKFDVLQELIFED